MTTLLKFRDHTLKTEMGGTLNNQTREVPAEQRTIFGYHSYKINIVPACYRPELVFTNSRKPKQVRVFTWYREGRLSEERQVQILTFSKNQNRAS